MNFDEILTQRVKTAGIWGMTYGLKNYDKVFLWEFLKISNNSRKSTIFGNFYAVIQGFQQTVTKIENFQFPSVVRFKLVNHSRSTWCKQKKAIGFLGIDWGREGKWSQTFPDFFQGSKRYLFKSDGISPTLNAKTKLQSLVLLHDLRLGPSEIWWTFFENSVSGTRSNIYFKRKI